MRAKPAVVVGLAIGLGVLSGAMCPMTPPDASNSNTNSNSAANDNGTTNQNGSANTNSNSSADRFRLTVNWQGDGFGTSLAGAAVWVFIGDDRILRSEGDYRVGPNTMEFIRSPNSPGRTREYDVPAGKVVTLVAFEDAGKTLNLWGTGANGPTPLPPEETFQIEFIRWDGDFDSDPENGVGAVTMNSDKEVTVTFAPMPTIEVSQRYEGRYRIEIDVPNWLNHPTLGGVSPTADCTGTECETACLGGRSESGTWLHLAYKTGSVLTITSLDCNASQNPWIEWGVLDACNGRTCNLVFGTHEEAIAMWDEK